jgi:uncharacterized membrane protein
MIQFARPFFVLVLVISAVLIGVTVDRLPVQIASHFGPGGAPNGWMSHSGYLLFMLAFAIGIPLTVVLSMAFLPRHMGRGVNIPNRDYWLDPSRREATFRYIEAHAYWLGSLIAAFVAAIHLLLIEANATQPPRLPGPLFVALLVGFLVTLGILMVSLLLHFRNRT